jgi:type I restriction enzyme R subunit
MSLIELVVECGAAAVDQLPAGIRNNPEAVAETIENNVRRVIIDEHPVNPKYYERMSDLLDTLIRQRRDEALSYREYLAKVVELTRQVQNPAGGPAYPRRLDSPAKRALYDNLGNDEALALALDGAIRATKKDGWRGNTMKEREVLYVIHQLVGDEAEVERIFELVKNQREY